MKEGNMGKKEKEESTRRWGREVGKTKKGKNNKGARKDGNVKEGRRRKEYG